MTRAGAPSGPRGHLCLVIKDLDIGRGGAERIYVELANLLFRAGYRVTCLHHGAQVDRVGLTLDEGVEIVNLAGPAGRRISPLLKSRRFRRAGLRALRIAYRLPLAPRLIWEAVHGRFTRALRGYFEQARPQIAISFLPPANTPTLIAARRTPVHVIPTNHNVPAADYDDPSRWDPNPHDRTLRLAMLDFAAAIHVLSPRFRGWFPERLQDKLVVIPNYVSPQVLGTKPRPVREKLVLAVGRLAPVKSYSLLVEAWSRIAPLHPAWRVELHGSGPEQARLADQVRRLGLERSFYLMGHTADIGQAYARAAIFCHPARFEGFGLAVAEALALGLPALAFSDCAGVNELITHNVNGLLVPRADGVGALATGLAGLIDDEALRARLAANGPASMAAFNMDDYARRWIGLIEEVAGR